MSSHVHTLRVSRLLGISDIIIATFILSYPAFFAELIYPQLTPYGIVLAIKMIGWSRFGRGLCSLSAPKTCVTSVTAWLWLSSLPVHCAALWYLSIESEMTLIWHITHLILIALMTRILLVQDRIAH